MNAIDLESEILMESAAGGRFKVLAPEIDRNTNSAPMTTPSITDLLADLTRASRGHTTVFSDQEVPAITFIDRVSANPGNCSTSALMKPLNPRQHQALVLLSAAVLRGHAIDNPAETDASALQDFADKLVPDGGPHITAVLGPAGTGKTTVLRAFRRYLGLIGMTDRVRFCASTGAAAGQIGGAFA